MARWLTAAGLVLLAPFLLLGAGLVLVLAMTLGGMGGGDQVVDESCGSPAVTPVEVTEGQTIDGYGPEQLENARIIMTAGADLGLGVYGQTIGVMTAMGESTLRVIDYGDAVGPDSRGLFQQRDNGAWGTYEDRMDPYTSATNFFKALMRVPGWEEMEPTMAAHRTQINDDPLHYTKYWPTAVAIVEELGGAAAAEGLQLSGPAACAPVYSAGSVSDSGWAHPVPGFSIFWDNYDEDRGSYRHTGEDFAAPSGHPILAAAEGAVSHMSCQRWEGRSPCNVVIDHGQDDQGRMVQTVYVHMFPEQVYVQQGQQVAAGETIGGVGNNGNSTGYHLHFEVWVGGDPVDPEEFMASVGIDLSDPTATELVNAPALA